LEQALLRTLAQWSVTGHRVQGAPGVYVNLDAPFSHQKLDLTVANLQPNAELSSKTQQGPAIAKIAALGIKVSQKGCYHGLSLNVAMDLRPFTWINPCGYSDLKVTDMDSLGVNPDMNQVHDCLAHALKSLL
jgi:lipoyl(octanoyl) transferase